MCIRDRAHAAAYVMMAFRIAYFKVNYPVDFYIAYFTVRADLFDATIMTKGVEKVREEMRKISLKGKDKTANEKDLYTILEICQEMYERGKMCIRDRNQAVRLDDETVNTMVHIGDDSYYMASSTAIGMSAPTPLGAAPVIKGEFTYVPADMFNILCGKTAYTVKDNTCLLYTSFIRKAMTQPKSCLIFWDIRLMMSKTFFPSFILKKPAHCSNAFGPSLGTFLS